MTDRRMATAVLSLLLAGCDAQLAGDAAAPEAVTVQPLPPREAAPSAPGRTAPSPAPPTPGNRPPLNEMAPQKPFTDPPLPRELLDDGDLTPLPSPPQRR
jgi:hypothetical protein